MTDLDDPDSDRDLAHAIDTALAQTSMAIRVTGEPGQWHGHLLGRDTGLPLCGQKFASSEPDFEEARYAIYQQVMTFLVDRYIEVRDRGSVELH